MNGRLRALLANASLALTSLALFALLLEGLARALDFGTPQIHRIRSVEPESCTSFLPDVRDIYETPEYRFELATNAWGRRDVAWTVAQLADPENVLFVGDSMTLGYGVEHAATISSQLETLLTERGQPTEVFNFGMPGIGLPEYGDILADAFASGFSARTVLVGLFVGNDFQPTVLCPPPPPPPRSVLLAALKQRLAGSPRVVNAALVIGSWLGKNLYETASSSIFLREPSVEQQASFQHTLDVLGEIAELCAGAGRRLRVVVFPNKIQVENRAALDTGAYDATRPNRLIADYCAARGIVCFDLMPALVEAQERGAQLFFPVDRHLTADGNRIAAQAIARFLAREPGAGSPPPGSRASARSSS